jgi:glycosyltransferase involved in cell wall biosynthesis
MVIPNGVVAVSATSQEERRNARLGLGLRPEQFVVAYVAHVRRDKGHRYLPAIARRLHDHYGIQPLFLLLGRVDDRPKYRDAWIELQSEIERLKASPFVKSLGAVEDVGAILAACDTLLLMSDREGMSNAILEGMQAGLPIVASDVGGASEVITNGVEGWIVQPKDGDEAAQRLAWLAARPRARDEMGERGRQRVSTNYSVPKMVAAYGLIYAQLALRAERQGHQHTFEAP